MSSPPSSPSPSPTQTTPTTPPASKILPIPTPRAPTTSSEALRKQQRRGHAIVDSKVYSSPSISTTTTLTATTASWTDSAPIGQDALAYQLYGALSSNKPREDEYKGLRGEKRDDVEEPVPEEKKAGKWSGLKQTLGRHLGVRRKPGTGGR